MRAALFRHAHDELIEILAGVCFGIECFVFLEPQRPIAVEVARERFDQTGAAESKFAHQIETAAALAFVRSAIRKFE